ncbi:MAG: beta-lactamase family protein [Robiginitomaculum sp.]|nr:beta-lactamase family protein [Robiginitomaculum sp.]
MRNLKKLQAIGFIAIFVLAACSPVPVQEVVAPQNDIQVSERAERLDSLLSSLIQEKAVPGISLLVIENGKETYFNVQGNYDLENQIPQTRASVARYYSMTKPIVGVALMTLFEDGKFALDDPIAQYLPEYAELKVYVAGDDTTEASLAEPIRAVTIRDLMRHTSGMTYGLFTNTAVDKMYREAGILSLNDTNTQMSQKLAKLPLQAQPGTKWIYGVSVDVQGRLIEVLSGKTLGEFLEETIFEPLQMSHTGFTVKPNDRELFGPAYRLSKTGLTKLSDERHNTPITVENMFLEDVAFESGGSGLVSTIDDFAQFAKMLLDEGMLGDVRILKPETLAMMTRDQLGNADHGWLGKDMGFGLNFAIKTGAVTDGSLPQPVGSYGWSGLAGTYFWVDPQNQLTVILHIQVLGHEHANIRKRVVAAVYGVELQ